ncbi:tetratricopeptide repeat protein [Azovibrio restrictus]|uniref:tetratricopeptide repeat protein n=1 Tax=Azovibrio restrictus TaxID=146938 RepID=UPI0026EB8489|nr:tetratricopeptide repeat protein [Azovibrio restrictus]MDD3481559.1 tetratricopeptide repeat protein [Azovibrio restrictus]
MSLLMDTLKRAPQRNLQLEPLEPATTRSLPDLAQQLDAVNADLAAPQERSPDCTGTARPGRPLFWMLALGGLGLLAPGAYFWRQLQTLENPPPPLATTSPLAPAAPATPPIRPEERDKQAIPRAMNNHRLALAQVAEAPLRKEAAPAPSELHIQRQAPPQNPGLQQAHAALERGALAQARQDFTRVLQQDPHNLDALLGLAAITLHEGSPGEAQQYYQAALVAHPRDPRAQAGLLGLNSEQDPEGTESRLRTLLGEQPDAPALHFALGNLLAARQRWAEAQAAYFQACSLDGSNPDYRFNLAVSLEQLRQSGPAADYYRQALEAAHRRPATFNPEQARERLRLLEGSAS